MKYSPADNTQNESQVRANDPFNGNDSPRQGDLAAATETGATPGRGHAAQPRDETIQLTGYKLTQYFLPELTVPNSDS